MKRILITLGCLIVFFCVLASQAQTFPLKASSNNRYLVDQNGRPFLIVGDSPHTMFANISEADATRYIQDRSAHGVNTLWCDIIVDSYVGGALDWKTYDNIAPFTAALGGGSYDLTTPNEAYFARIDREIATAAANGIVVFLDPAETAEGITTLEANGLTRATTYGEYLGNRYKNTPNIVWLMGNDFQTWENSTDNKLVNNVMAGIQATDPNHIQTLQLEYPVSGSLDDALLVHYVDLAGAYTYYPTYYEVYDQYSSAAKTVPVFLSEGYYDGKWGNGQMPTNWMLRKQAYWTITSGGAGGYLAGTTYYDFHSGWQSGIDDTTNTELHYWGGFTRSYRWYDLVPDNAHSVVTAGYGTGTNGCGEGNAAGDVATNICVTTARIADGSLVMSYCPSACTITVDMTKLQGSVMAHWYNPADNSYSTVNGSPFQPSGSRQFTNPYAEDGVLVLQTGDWSISGGTVHH